MKKNIWTGVVLLLAVCSLAGGWRWYDTYYRLPGLPTTVDEAVKVIGSPAFKRLPEDRRAAYLETSRKLFEKMPIEERRAYMLAMRDKPEAKEAAREAGAEMMMSRAKQFAQLPDIARNLLLDQLIKAQENMTKKAKENAAKAAPMTDEKKAERKARQDAAMAEAKAYIQKQIESGNPQRQALVGEGMKALRARRIAQGLSPDPEPMHR
jgi:hypothetical protein